MHANGQDNGLRTKLIDENYEKNFQSSSAFDSFYFELQSVQSSQFKTHIRIKMAGQIIDFYSMDNIKYYGILTNYTLEYMHVKSKKVKFSKTKKYRYHIGKTTLKQTKVDSIVNILFHTGQAEIPTDTLIPAWRCSFLHCEGIVFQFKINGKYSKQTYHCPWGQNDTMAYKNIILNNYQSLISIFQLNALYDSFENKLPKGKTYTIDGYRMSYMMTARQIDIWKQGQPMRDYLKSIKDTIDSYLKAELKKKQVELSTSDCFQSYYLLFGKNGRLKKVMVSPTDKPLLKDAFGPLDYWTERRHIKKCERKIKKIFNDCDLGFLNLKYNIYRTISFCINNEAYLRDQTTY